MPKDRVKEPSPAAKSVPGYLVCSACERVIPYHGLPDMALTGAPQHRCPAKSHTLHHFTRWSREDPYFRSNPLREEAS
jgi:hypothetical protein